MQVEDLNRFEEPYLGEVDSEERRDDLVRTKLGLVAADDPAFSLDCRLGVVVADPAEDLDGATDAQRMVDAVRVFDCDRAVDDERALAGPLLELGDSLRVVPRAARAEGRMTLGLDEREYRRERRFSSAMSSCFDGLQLCFKKNVPSSSEAPESDSQASTHRSVRSRPTLRDG